MSALLIPVYGAVGAAAAILATRVAVNALGAVLAYRLTGFLVVDPGLNLIMGVATVALGLAAFDAAPPALAAAILTLGLIAVLAQSRKLLIEMGRAAVKWLRSGPD